MLTNCGRGCVTSQHYIPYDRIFMDPTSKNDGTIGDEHPGEPLWLDQYLKATSFFSHAKSENLGSFLIKIGKHQVPVKINGKEKSSPEHPLV